ncbi:MAG: hypothetical protein M3X11_22265 [Acidobacteriota bacterium]|nr:hypothetical protein [Acidobacteriota bacterium]
MPDSSLDSQHYEDFLPHVNSKFTAQSNNASTVELELLSVEEKSPSPRQEQFILTFRAPFTASAQQQIFNLHHEQLGSGSMFLVPIGKDASGIIYEAVFNRPRSVQQ